jgi:hypothetical protein
MIKKIEIMKRLELFSKMLILLLSISTFAIGQYTGSHPDVAFSKPVLATDSVAGHEPGYAVDDSVATYCIIPGDAPAWIQIDLRTDHYIDGYGLILPDADELPGEYIFQVSANGSTWTDLGTETITLDDSYSYDVSSPDPIRYVRIYMTTKDPNASFAEIYVYGYEAIPPDPPVALPAINITPTGFIAHWDASARADGYVISVAMDPGFTNFVPGYENLWAASYLFWDVSGLAPGTTYYYRLRAYNLAGTSIYGNAISATTAKAPQDISFESLTPFTYGDNAFDLTATASSGLPVSYASSEETVATISGNTVTIVGVGTTSITATQDGNTQYLAAAPVIRDLLVIRKSLSVEDAVAENKVYDGTNDAVISGATLVGVVGADDVSLSGDTAGMFAQSGVGISIEVNTTMFLSGTDTANYTLIQPSVLTADIAPKALTVTGATAENKVYDGTTDAVISGATLMGVVGAEDVQLSDAETGVFAQADVGEAIEVIASMSLTGADIDNYTISQPSITADITAKELTVTGASAENKVYDGTTDAVISGATLNGVVGTDDVQLWNAEAGVFAQAGAGTGIAVSASMYITGTDIVNYLLSVPTDLSADISAKELVVTAVNKSREQCASNPEFTVTYEGFAGAEDAGVLDSEPVATCLADANSAAGTYDITVSGGSAANYYLTYVSGTLTVITDYTPPVLVIQNITIQLDDSGNAEITAADLVTSASDNCSIADTTLSRSSFTDSDIGYVNVEVTVTDGSGNSTSNVAVVTVQGSTGIASPDRIRARFYPNPTDGLMKLDANSQADEMKVMDMTGKTILRKTDLGKEESIDLSGYHSGLYIIQLRFGDDSHYYKVVKK